MSDSEDDWDGPSFRDLPPFPTGPLIGHPETVASTYKWAGYMIATLGSDAPYHALNAVLKCIDLQDDASKRAWRNISDAINDLARPPGPDETLH